MRFSSRARHLTRAHRGTSFTDLGTFRSAATILNRNIAAGATAGLVPIIAFYAIACTHASGLFLARTFVDIPQIRFSYTFGEIKLRQ